jgi:hypothetical protein
VEFNPGKNNTVADALSRCDEDARAAHSLSSLAFEVYEEFRREAETLPNIIWAKEDIANGMTSAVWSVVDRFVLHDGRVFVSSTSALWPKLLAIAHDAASRRHCSVSEHPSSAPTLPASSGSTSRVVPSPNATRRGIFTRRSAPPTRGA